jgi:hypothetical protein
MMLKPTDIGAVHGQSEGEDVLTLVMRSFAEMSKNVAEEWGVGDGGGEDHRKFSDLRFSLFFHYGR